MLDVALQYWTMSRKTWVTPYKRQSWADYSWYCLLMAAMQGEI